MDEILIDKNELNLEKDTNKKIDELVKENPSIILDYPILELEYNHDGTKKEFYNLASEKEIKETQIKSDENELDFKYSQNKITKEEYDTEKEILKNKLLDQNLVYDNLIFEMIRDLDIEVLKKQVIDAKLDDIELKRLATSLSSIADNKIDEFQRNNKEFKENNISYWNYKYDLIAKNYSKTREIESFILSLIN